VNLGREEPASSLQLCWEVKLGNVDIVEALLALGHGPDGSPEHRPIEKAVLINHPIPNPHKWRCEYQYHVPFWSLDAFQLASAVSGSA
jgi:hypothetical protein